MMRRAGVGQIGGEDRLARLHAQRRQNGLGRDAAVAGEMDFGNAEAGIGHDRVDGVDRRHEWRGRPCRWRTAPRWRRTAPGPSVISRIGRRNRRRATQHGRSNARIARLAAPLARAMRRARRAHAAGRAGLRVARARGLSRGLRSTFSDRMRRPPPSSGTVWRRTCPDGRPVPAPARSASCRAGCWFPAGSARCLVAGIVIAEIGARHAAAAQRLVRRSAPGPSLPRPRLREFRPAECGCEPPAAYLAS